MTFFIFNRVLKFHAAKIGLSGPSHKGFPLTFQGESLRNKKKNLRILRFYTENSCTFAFEFKLINE